MSGDYEKLRERYNTNYYFRNRVHAEIDVELPGFLALLKTGKYDEAEELLVEGIQHNPIVREICKFNLGATRSAQKASATIERILPGYTALEESGNHAAARQMLKDAFENPELDKVLGKELFGIEVDDPQKEHPSRTDQKANLVDRLYKLDFPEHAIKDAADFFGWIDGVRKKDIASHNPTFTIVDKEGIEWHLKSSDSESRAGIEAATGYYLPEHFSFMVPTGSPIPLKCNGEYINLQRQVPSHMDKSKGLDYWINCLAIFHRDAEKILREKRIDVPEAHVYPADLQEEKHDKGKQVNGIQFSPIEWNNWVSYLKQSGSKAIIHGDLKRDNLLGPYMIDLEVCGTGNPAIDLSMILMQHKVPVDEWDAHIRKYLAAKYNNEPSDEEFRQLKESMPIAARYIATKVLIGSSLRRVDASTREEHALLRQYLQEI
jgi:hypothetical protein